MSRETDRTQKKQRELAMASKKRRELLSSFALIVVLLSMITTVGFGLSRLDPDRNIEICEEAPVLCEQLEFGWCKHESRALVEARWADEQAPSGRTLFDRLRAVDVYERCIERATGIEPTKNTERKHNRVKNWLDVLEEQKQLRERMMQMPDSPWPLYYRSALLADKQAMQHLIKLNDAGLIDDPEIWPKLAQHFSRRDPAKAIRLLHNTLQAHRPFTISSPELPRQLAYMYRHVSDAQAAYLWSSVANELAENPVELGGVELYQTLSQQEHEQLERLAERVAAQLVLGRYRGVPDSHEMPFGERLVAWGGLNGALSWLNHFYPSALTAGW